MLLHVLIEPGVNGIDIPFRQLLAAEIAQPSPLLLLHQFLNAINSFLGGQLEEIGSLLGRQRLQPFVIAIERAMQLLAMRGSCDRRVELAHPILLFFGQSVEAFFLLQERSLFFRR